MLADLPSTAAYLNCLALSSVCFGAEQVLEDLHSFFTMLCYDERCRDP
jgi:hypothetical protein